MTNKPHKLPGLEGIRGIAAMIVVMAHLRNIFFYDLDVQLAAAVLAKTGSQFLANGVKAVFLLFFDGKLAVYVFWFMSGYVITIGLFRNKDRHYFAEVLIKRYFRLVLPMIGASLFAYLLLRAGWMYNGILEQSGLSRYPELGSFYRFPPDAGKAFLSAAWDPFFQYSDTLSYDPVMWTMRPELFGSYACFFLFALMGRWRYRFQLYILLALLSVLAGWAWLAVFFAGMLLSDIDNTGNPLKELLSNFFEVLLPGRWIPVLLIVALLFLYGFLRQDYNDILVAPVAVLVVTICMKTAVVARFFAGRLFTFLGKLSFSMYLLHFPLLYSFSCFFYLQLGWVSVSHVLITCSLSIFLLILAAVVFQQLVDKPAILFSNQVARWILRKKQ